MNRDIVGMVLYIYMDLVIAIATIWLFFLPMLSAYRGEPMWLLCYLVPFPFGIYFWWKEQ